MAMRNLFTREDVAVAIFAAVIILTTFLF